MFPSRQTVDAEGDIRMSGTNAIIAAIGGSIQNSERVAVKPRDEPKGRFVCGTGETHKEKQLPRALWRSQ